MNISGIGNMQMIPINVGFTSATIQSKSVVSAEDNLFSTSDGLVFSNTSEASAPSFAQMMQTMHGEESTGIGAESAELTSASSEQEVPEHSAEVQGTKKPGPDATPEDVAAYCVGIAKGEGTVAERTELITEALSQGISKADTPNTEWVQATPEQLKLYVQETLEHVDAVRQIGELRGLDFENHDLEAKTGKFEPRIAQYLALPGREDSVKWSISEHNYSPHHATWKDPNASVDDLAESASDIVNAWRMNRRVYNKPSWSWERIADFVDAQYQNNELSTNQRDAILQAIPFQMEWEAKYGLPS